MFTVTVGDDDVVRRKKTRSVLRWSDFKAGISIILKYCP